MRFDQPPVVRLTVEAGRSGRGWPWSIPAVAQVVTEGLTLAPGITVLVGENGSGKSTIVEAAAVAYGLSPEGGTVNGHHSTRPTESPLGEALTLQRGAGTKRWGFFLRAETMHSWYTFAEGLGGSDPRYHEMSHGESFTELIAQRLRGPGFYVLDEPEAALSFAAQLGLVAALQQVVEEGGQVLMATHSPVLAAIPGATLLQASESGLQPARWDDLDLVWHWKAFMDAPQRYLRHLSD